ncbi:hypothetical protein VKT23_015848 [Stygiomarasmius scandens]|uniref:Uncharacterized protein n=1 Tax=Marasmiellus scandens TaxID=2682957 RepID=A0ABR1IWP3_9AGAR
MFFLKSFVIVTTVALVSGTPAVENRAVCHLIPMASRRTTIDHSFLYRKAVSSHARTETTVKTSSGIASKMAARAHLPNQVTPLELVLRARSMAAPVKSAAVVMALLVVVETMVAMVSRAHAPLEHSKAALATKS